jgi:hypothetical protein
MPYCDVSPATASSARKLEEVIVANYENPSSWVHGNQAVWPRVKP